MQSLLKYYKCRQSEPIPVAVWKNEWWFLCMLLKSLFIRFTQFYHWMKKKKKKSEYLANFCMVSSAQPSEFCSLLALCFSAYLLGNKEVVYHIPKTKSGTTPLMCFIWMMGFWLRIHGPALLHNYTFKFRIVLLRSVAFHHKIWCPLPSLQDGESIMPPGLESRSFFHLGLMYIIPMAQELSSISDSCITKMLSNNGGSDCQGDLQFISWNGLSPWLKAELQEKKDAFLTKYEVNRRDQDLENIKGWNDHEQQDKNWAVFSHLCQLPYFTEKIFLQEVSTEFKRKEK